MNYAETGQAAPREYDMAQLVRAYGAAAVVGRVMSCGELRRMRAAENIITAHRSRTASDNWAKWASQNPEQSRVLIAAEKMRDG